MKSLGLLAVWVSGAALAGAPAVALLESEPQGTQTALVLQAVDAAQPAAASCTLLHPRGATARGTVVPGTRAVAMVADLAPSRDLSWAAALIRMEPGKPPLTLADRVNHASRPLVTASGRVFVARGVAGPDPLPADTRRGVLRVDDLSVDEVNFDTGQARTLYRSTGYITFLAGSLGAEIFIYRVAPSGAELIAVDIDTRRVRMLAPALLPFARDFAVDAAGHALLFTERDDASASLWWAERMDVTTGARTKLLSSDSLALRPHPWPGGRLCVHPDGPRGMAVLGAPRALSAPLGAGGDEIRDISADQAWVAVSHERPGELPEPFVISADGRSVNKVAAPPGLRVDVAGFVPGGIR